MPHRPHLSHGRRPEAHNAGTGFAGPQAIDLGRGRGPTVHEAPRPAIDPQVGAWPPASAAQPSPRPVAHPSLSASWLGPLPFTTDLGRPPPSRRHLDPRAHVGALESPHAVPHAQPRAATPHASYMLLRHTPSPMTCCRAPRHPSDVGLALCRPCAPAVVRGEEDVGGEWRQRLRFARATPVGATRASSRGQELCHSLRGE
jgi:hypothetical protein